MKIINGIKIIETVSKNYGEAYICDNSDATVIETAGTPIALRQIVGGILHNFSFDAGSTSIISAFADGTGGKVLVSSAGHGLSNGKIITIRGTTNYNGIFAVSDVTTNNFKITDTWVADDGASDWDQGSSLTCLESNSYMCYWRMNTGPDAACTLTWEVNINATPQCQSISEKKMAVNDYDSCSSSCILILTAGDTVWLSVQSDNTADITNKYGAFNIHNI